MANQGVAQSGLLVQDIKVYMHRGMIYSFIGVVILLSIVSCSPYYGVTKGYKLPLIEFPEPLDKERFVAYLDTAAVDDWEGCGCW